MAVAVHVFNPSTWEAELGSSLRVRGQPDLQNEIAKAIQKKNEQKENQREKNSTHGRRVRNWGSWDIWTEVHNMLCYLLGFCCSRTSPACRATEPSWLLQLSGSCDVSSVVEIQT